MVEKAPVDPHFEALLRFIQESRGLDFRGYKRTSLRRRITLRMEATASEDFAAYQARLEAEPGEFDSLLNTVFINVTSFFRDAEAWDVLRDQVIPQIIARDDQQSPIRVWSAGCASGEEPYSVAMLLAEALGIGPFCERVKIYATDLDENALRAARNATYTAREVEAVPAPMLEQYFDRTTNHYVFNRELRKCVIFGQHNLVKDAPIGRIDLLLCRNLLIYLESETQDIVLPRLHYALSPDGFLFLGKAETQLARSALFEPVEMKHRIFSKVPQEWRRPNGGALATREWRGTLSEDQELISNVALNEAPTAYLVVNSVGLVTLANRAARDLLSVGEADLGRPFQDLPISYRPLELRGPIEEVLRDRRAIRLEHQEYLVSQSEAMRLTIEIRPLALRDGAVHAALLSFTDSTRLYTTQMELQTAQENLENSIEELQSANEELETTNEELQSTNEELETTNEELQSTNEELETMNEEARSSNEEMESVNEELRLQAEQAVAVRAYLESIFRSLDMGLVVIDGNGHVQSWNRWSEKAWGLRAEEVIGASFDGLDVGFPVHLLRDAITEVQSGRSQLVERTLEGIDRRGRPIICHISVMTLVPEEGRTNAGAVLAFADVTDERRREDYTRYLGRIMGRALNEIYFLDPESLHFTLANTGAEVKLGCSASQLAQLALSDVLPSVTADDLKAMLKPVLSGERPDIVVETTIRPVEGEDYLAEICMQYFADEAPPILVAMVHDTRERKRLAAE